MIYPKELEELIEYFKKLPGIGEKSAERLAISLLDFSEDAEKEQRIKEKKCKMDDIKVKIFWPLNNTIK